MLREAFCPAEPASTRLSPRISKNGAMAGNKFPPWLRFRLYASCSLRDYFKVTFAPSASSLALMSSAVALSAASLRTLGAPSTRSLASFKPKPVASRTTLITLTLFGPTSVNSTSNSVFSSAAAPSPAPAAATTTPAAADTPNSSSQAFTKSFHSNTLNSLIASINSAVVIFAMIIFLHLILRLYHDDTFSACRSLRLFSLHSIRIILPESLLPLLQELPLPEQPLLPRQLRRPFLRSD